MGNQRQYPENPKITLKMHPVLICSLSWNSPPEIASPQMAISFFETVDGPLVWSRGMAGTGRLHEAGHTLPASEKLRPETWQDGLTILDVGLKHGNEGMLPHSRECNAIKKARKEICFDCMFIWGCRGAPASAHRRTSLGNHKPPPNHATSTLWRVGGLVGFIFGLPRLSWRSTT